MFEKSYEQRLAVWHDFRESLELSNDPIQDVIDFYYHAPRVSIHTDPYDDNTWPTPWELIKENQYCRFCLLLGMCYTLQLTERLNGKTFEIHIVHDDNNSDTLFLLFVGDTCIGYDYDTPVPVSELPKDLHFETSYVMPALQ